MATPIRQPIEQLLAFELIDGQGNADASFVVPKSKRFVIEFITADFTVQIGQKAVVTFFVQTAGVGPPGIVHTLVLVPQGTFTGDVFAASQLVRLYADPRSTVLFQLARNQTTGVAGGNISVTGYLEDAPSPAKQLESIQALRVDTRGKKVGIPPRAEKASSKK